MKTIVIGSTNPVKLETTKESFASIFQDEELKFETYAATSGVPDQPMGSNETKTGAENRALDCKVNFPEADFFVGLEGGLEKDAHEYWAFAWMCVIDQNGRRGYGKTGSFMLPPELSRLVEAGHELGHATDVVFNEVNSKHKGGTIGILTDEVITRKDFYREAIVFALIPFVKPELYPVKKL